MADNRRSQRSGGDLACSPGHYVDLGPHRFAGFAEDAGACDLAVLGGGLVLRDCVDHAIYRVAAARRVVIWGRRDLGPNGAAWNSTVWRGGRR